MFAQQLKVGIDYRTTIKHRRARRGDGIEFGQCSDPEVVAVLESYLLLANVSKLRSEPFLNSCARSSNYFLHALVDENQTRGKHCQELVHNVILHLVLHGVCECC